MPKSERLDEQIVVHHPDLKLQARVSRGAFLAPKSPKCPKGGLKEKGWKLGELPATKGGGS